jgi:hypothetical protein
MSVPQVARQWFGCALIKSHVVITLEVQPQEGFPGVAEPKSCSGERACGVEFLSSACPYKPGSRKLR